MIQLLGSIQKVTSGRSRMIALALGYLTMILTVPSKVLAGPLGPASPYNVFVFGSFSESGADTGGRLAVGGNASFANYYAISQSVIDIASAPNNDFLVVDGNILSGPTNLDAGNAYVGGSGASLVQYPGGGHRDASSSSPIVNGSTVGVANQATYFKNYSAQLSQLTPNGSFVNNYGTITFTGTDPTLDVFNVDISILGGNNTININDPSSATVVINVTGTSGTTTGASININGGGANGDSTTVDSKKVLFNFFQATSLTFGGSVLGSVLAPYASVTGLSRQLDGQLIAASYSGSTEFHDLLFNGTSLPNPSTTTSSPTPEPGTLLMIVIGVGLVSVTRLRTNKRRN